jgi:D-alanyl-D-alanine carboxypeptidase
MNETARRLGMFSTHYDNANGLPDDGQLTTARDLAVLAHAIDTDFPEYRDYFGIPAIKAGKRILRSENALLERYRGTTGMKTGFVCASGYNIVATAQRGGRSLIAVVLGADSGDHRSEFTAHLLDQGFNGFATAFASKVDLADFEAVPTLGSAADMHDQVCEGHAAADTEESGDDSSGDNAVSSSLVPRFVLMDPVPVFTGHADATLPGVAPPATPAPAKPAAVVAVKVPIPHLRPAATVASPAPAVPAAVPAASPGDSGSAQQ